MAWTIRLSEAAENELAKLDKPVAKRITSFLRDRIATSGDPRTLGVALKGSRFGELWRFRQGDYRIIASINDQTVQVLVVRIGHRREIYQR